MKLHELKKESLGRFVDLSHIEDMGRICYRAGFDATCNPYKEGSQHGAWRKGYEVAKRAWENFLHKNGGDRGRQIWM